MVTITKYVWDTVSDCVLSELDENNAVKAVYTNEPQQYGGVLSQRRGTTSHYHHHDALGSTRFLTDSSGNVTDTYLNDAWGNSVASTGTTVNPFRWVGKYGYYTDDSTGQVYVRARMYQPTVARWCSWDPLHFVDGNNLYAYTHNLLTATDPSGQNALIRGDEVPKIRPRIPIDWPAPDPPIDPMCFIANCNAYTVAEWGEDLCNFEKRPGDRPCPCHTMKDAGQPLTDDEIRQLFEDARSRVAMLNIEGLCTVELAVRDKCSTTPGFGRFAVTCPGKSGKNPKICFPKTISRCDAAGLMEHEMLHALQACQGRAGKPFPGASNPLEREAYRINCTAQEIHDCIPPGPLRNIRIENCIKEGARNSTGGSGGGAFDEICKELQGNGGGW